MEVPRLGVKSELQLPADTTVTATQNPSHVCDLHHSSRQQGFLNFLSEVRGRTRILMDTSQILFHCATMRAPRKAILNRVVREGPTYSEDRRLGEGLSRRWTRPCQGPEAGLGGVSDGRKAKVVGAV